MSTNHGQFVWYDVMTTDCTAAERFYGRVIGWDAKDAGMNDKPYTIFSVGTTPVGGLMPIPEEVRAAGAPPHWSGYIGVEDVDAYAKRVTAAGGSIHRAPEDIPGVGRFAVAADPNGAHFILFHGNGEMPPRPAPGTPGYVGWHELQADDQTGAFAFYAGLFGWTKSDAIDMGPMGTYQIFAMDGVPAGGMMTKRPEARVSHWLYYFNVDAADAAVARVNEAGGKVCNGPHEVPGGMWIVQATDPQGAMFAMVAPKR
jgi:uncharacterized protein